jgi:hypothetical protein
VDRLLFAKLQRVSFLVLKLSYIGKCETGGSGVGGVGGVGGGGAGVGKVGVGGTGVGGGVGPGGGVGLGGSGQGHTVNGQSSFPGSHGSHFVLTPSQLKIPRQLFFTYME